MAMPAALASLLSAAASTARAGAPAIDWLAVALEMLGGLVLFLFGVDTLARALRALGGGRLQQVLERTSSNRVSALGIGTVATVALDSSSVVIILLITAVDAGLVPFAQALPVVLGANIGTTLSSQVFAWNVDAYAPVLMLAGFLLRSLAHPQRWKDAGTILLGIGLVLFALHLIGDAAEPLKDDPRVSSWLRALESPVAGVLVGAGLTVAIQSSSAMMGIVITLAGTGMIDLPAGLAIMLGAEIGTCADTLAATLGRSRAAVRAGVFHLLFNIATVAIGIALIGPLAAFARWSASDTGQQIANAHVLFNVGGALLALPFVRSVAGLLERAIPARDATPANRETAAA